MTTVGAVVLVLLILSLLLVAYTMDDPKTGQQKDRLDDEPVGKRVIGEAYGGNRSIYDLIRDMLSKKRNIQSRVPSAQLKTPYVSYCIFTEKHFKRLEYIHALTKEYTCAILVNYDNSIKPNEFISYGQKLNISSLFWLVRLEDPNFYRGALATVADYAEINGLAFLIDKKPAVELNQIIQNIEELSSYNMTTLVWIQEYPRWELLLNPGKLMDAGASPVIVESKNVLDDKFNLKTCNGKGDNKTFQQLMNKFTYNEYFDRLEKSFGPLWKDKYIGKARSVRIWHVLEKNAPKNASIPPRTILGRGFTLCLNETGFRSKNDSDCTFIPDLVVHTGLGSNKRVPRDVCLFEINPLIFNTVFDIFHPDNINCTYKAYSHLEREDFYDENFEFKTQECD